MSTRGLRRRLKLLDANEVREDKLEDAIAIEVRMQNFIKDAIKSGQLEVTARVLAFRAFSAELKPLLK